MRFRAIALENVRRFAGRSAVDGIGDGLNVLAEPNEHGKSTLFDAVQALFFKPHGSKDKEVRALQPHAGGAPEVTIEIETDEGRFVLWKRWLSKPAATVSQDGRLVAQADAAEAWIAQILGGEDGGPSGLLWVRQGMTALGGGSPKEEKAALERRRDLMSTVGHEVEAMTGGRRMDLALARCREELDVLATKTLRPRGPWKAAQDRVEALEVERDALAATSDALHEALQERRRVRRALAEIEDPDATTGRADRLTQATAAHAAALRHAEDVEAASRRVEAGRISVTRAQERLEALRTALSEQTAAREAVDAALAEAERAAAERDAAQGALDAAEEALGVAQKAREAAEASRRLAERQRAARDGVARRRELAQRIAEAEAARRTVEEAAAMAGQGPDAATMRRLETLAAERAAAVAARAASAPQVVMRHAPDRAGSVRMDGAPLVEGQAVAIPGRVRLEIDGIGTLDVFPGSGGPGGDAVEAAERALEKALAAVGAADLAAARVAADMRADAERRRREAKAVLDSLAPDGLDPLRAMLAAIPEMTEDADALLDPAAAETAVEAAEDARVAAQSVRDAGAGRLSDARMIAARAEAAASGAEDRLDRAEQAVARVGDEDEATLAAQFDRAREALDAAVAVHTEKARTAPDLAGAEAALARARAVDREARETIGRLKPELARLDERISRGAGDAVEERLTEAEERVTAARADLQRIEHEVAVLKRLEGALDAAKAEARERYFAPVAAELRPLLALLWPEAELRWEQETLLPTTLCRGGVEEPISILSGGTQEQVALLVRLAFARMLAKAGRHAPVILDDALVFTDDDRIERMFDALHRQAGDLQILVLSCRQRAFRDLGGRTLRLTPADPA
ncbi:DNA repair exonuclease SbcCD ATPase subunit [Palleronia marisminoris]|uniref:Chromosome segregation protein n=1 Tax=Palleronia marisminoris TaxID=315423 RepID=A0A1Y5R912_9RHOB|nr:ATP-binding protein [Palleronia marisminoris]SFG09241.1 DNA repair exonuclease SbcCD ATPase subunit [Palleronia marisminoris]SLN11906.1 chromosome segregation protein [Palleronia marisminoris]